MLALWEALYLAGKGGKALYRPLCSVYIRFRICVRCKQDLEWRFGDGTVAGTPPPVGRLEVEKIDVRCRKNVFRAPLPGCCLLLRVNSIIRMLHCTACRLWLYVLPVLVAVCCIYTYEQGGSCSVVYTTTAPAAAAAIRRVVYVLLL